jgi:hypothetical protein
VYSLWGRVEKMPIRKKRNSFFFYINGILTLLPMVYWPLYPWYINPPTHGILTPYPWYFDPPTHGISTPLSMVFWPAYPCYIDTQAQLVYWSPSPWYIDPPIHGILTPLPMEYWSPYTWYFDLPAYLLIRNGGGSIYHTRGV